MYRSVFTVGVAVTQVMYNTDGTLSSSALTSANVLTDYSYINALDGNRNGYLLARCLTGLGPTDNQNNGALGGLYFNGSMIPNNGEEVSCMPALGVVQVHPGARIAGVANFHQCRLFSTVAEGVYTCTMMNSSMMNQSVRFHIYLNGRSELLDLYIPSLNHLSFLYTQLLQ